MRFTLTAATAALALLVALPAYANTWDGKWNVNSALSKITFSASQSGQPFTGTLPAFNAAITLDTANLATAHIKVVMPLTGMTTGSSTRDADLPKPDWFDMAVHPEAVFESSKITAIDENGKYEAAGTLTIRGVSQPMTLPFDLALEDEMALATAKITFNRMPFGVGKGWPESSGVSENVTVDVVISAKRAEATETTAAPVPPESQPILLTPEAQ